MEAFLFLQKTGANQTKTTKNAQHYTYLQQRQNWACYVANMANYRLLITTIYLALQKSLVSKVSSCYAVSYLSMLPYDRRRAISFTYPRQSLEEYLDGGSTAAQHGVLL